MYYQYKCKGVNSSTDIFSLVHSISASKILNPLNTSLITVNTNSPFSTKTSELESDHQSTWCSQMADISSHRYPDSDF